jgi:protein O-GlcNAc transferase
VSGPLLDEALRLQRAGDHARAERLYNDVLASEPRNFDALYRLAFLCGQNGRFGEAEALMARAIALRPSDGNAHFMRGSALMRLDRLAEAGACFDAAIALRPNFAEALLNRAAILFRLRRHAEAGEDYGRLLAIDPDYPFARGNRLACRMQICDWRGLDAETAAVVEALWAGKRAIAPFDAKAIPIAPADELRCAEIWARDQAPPAAARLYNGEPYRHARIRIAYVAAQFGDNPVSALIADVIERHDRTRFEIAGLSFRSGDGSALHGRLARAFDRRVDGAGMDDAALARQLREMEADIAIDLMGYTEGCRPRVFAQRAAPVQAAYLGFPGTAGAPYIDYLIADATMVPERNRAHYREQIVALPGSFICAGPREIGRMPSRAEAGLPERGFVFACFHNSYKFNPHVFGIWMRLLNRIEGSVLWLPKSNPAVVENLLREAGERGVQPDRLVFAPFVPNAADHLARLGLADLFLDTLPYNAHSTAVDALSAGLPVLTCEGECFAGRVGASLLKAAAVPELIVHSLGEYEALALELARDPAMLPAIRGKLSAMRETAPLFDAARFTRNLEAAYGVMWERSQRGDPPATFAVEEPR